MTLGPDLIGASPHRAEDLRLVTGRGRYIDDLRREGMLHLGVVRSVHAHARIVGVAMGQARALPGVVAVWSAAELPEAARPVVAPAGSIQRDRFAGVPLLAADRARYVGEPVAIVVADTPYRLADAVDAVAIEYEPWLPLATPEEALGSAIRIHEGWPSNAALEVRGTVGRAETGFAHADVIVRARFRHARLAAVSIETRGAVAYRDPDTGTLTVWASIQNPYLLRAAVASVLDLPAEQVRVLVPDVGGGFGPKGSVYPDEILVAAAALRLDRPVKWIETRREGFAAVGHDREHVHEARAGFRRDGTILAVDDAFLADVGAYPVEGSGLTANTVNHLPGPYRVPHYRATGTSVVTNKTPNAAYRGAGRPEAALVMERLMDLGARRLGLDPAEIRRRNLVRPEEMPYRSGLVYKDGAPIAYDPGDFPAAFERALARLGYADWRARQRRRADSVRRLGIGLGCYAQGTGLGPFEGATVRVDRSGKVYVFVGVAAQGQGHATTLAQIAATEIGARLDDVVVVGGDTAVQPFGMGTGGSRVAANAGPAVARTARAARDRAARVAAELLECAPEDIRIEASRAYVAGVPDRATPLGRLAEAAVRSPALRELGEPGLNTCSYFYPDTVTWAFGTHACVVEVDLETCQISLLRYVVVHDPGRAINPAIVEGQLHGGAAQGIGAGLMEAVVYDDHGQLLTGSLMDYAIPRADDLPPLEVILDPHPSVVNPLGLKGVGESGCIPAAAAIANAVEDAVGNPEVAICEVPITAARLFLDLSRVRPTPS